MGCRPPLYLFASLAQAARSAVEGRVTPFSERQGPSSSVAVIGRRARCFSARPDETVARIHLENIDPVAARGAEGIDARHAALDLHRIEAALHDHVARRIAAELPVVSAMVMLPGNLELLGLGTLVRRVHDEEGGDGGKADKRGLHVHELRIGVAM